MKEQRTKKSDQILSIKIDPLDSPLYTDTYQAVMGINSVFQSMSAPLSSFRKYYVVWVGREPGVYDNWPDAEKQVKGFSGARHKSFLTREEAEYAFNNEKSDE